MNRWNACSRNTFVKKLLEDASGLEETSRLLRYCCWENNHFSWTVLSDLLWQVSLYIPISTNFSHQRSLISYLIASFVQLYLAVTWSSTARHGLRLDF